MTNRNTSEPAPANTATPIEPVAGHEQILLPRPANGYLPPVRSAAVAEAAQPQQAINVRSVLDALRRRWFIGLMLGTTLGSVAAYAAWTLVPAPYTAYTEIRIRSTVPTVPLRSANQEPPLGTLKQTHMQMVKSRDVLEKAFRDAPISRLQFFQDHDDEGDQIEILQRHLQVKSDSTEFFRISLSGDRSEDLKKIVLAVTSAYYKVVVEPDKGVIDRRQSKYKKIHDDEEAKLEALRKGLQDLIKDDPTRSKELIAKQKGIMTRRGDLYQRIADVTLKMRSLEMLADLKKKPDSKLEQIVPKEVIEAKLIGNSEYRERKSTTEKLRNSLTHLKKNQTPNDPRIQETERELKDSERRLSELKKKLTPEIVRDLKSTIPGQVARTDAQIQFELAVLQKQLDYLKGELETVKGEEIQAGLGDVKIQTQMSKIEQQQKYTQALKNEITRMEAQREFGDMEPRIVIPTRAEVSSRPNMKKKYMGTAAAGFGTFGLILAGIVLLDIRLKRISSIQQVADRVGLAVVGTIPAIPKTATARKDGRWSAKARYWHSVLTESVDAARTVLLREAEQNSLGVLMIASAMGGEGKTSVSCHLATSLARAGRKVLLIDGDMRRPFIHQTFDLPVEPGFAEILRGDAELSDALHATDIPGLSIMPAGRISQSALEILTQDRPGEMLAELRTRFDFIVFDSPPVLPVTDSLLIAQHVDAVLFTIRRDVSRASKVLASCEKLHRLGVPLLGAIAVGLDDDSSGYSYSYRYGYNPYNSPPAN